jgi:hypothetical protein
VGQAQAPVDPLAIRGIEMIFTIHKQVERYPDICPELPVDFKVEGLTRDQALFLAECLTNRQAGCDYAFYAIDGNGEEIG